MYSNHITYQFIHMTIFWIICCVRKNGSMVDLGWPSGFFVMTIYFFFTGSASIAKKLIICLPLFLAGLRFIVGWAVFRNHFKHEDRRWELWRERWRNGEGWLGIKSIPLNFFFFYHCQSMTNALILTLPLSLVCHSDKGVTLLEIAGVIIWSISFALENVADQQLTDFKIKNKGNKANTVCRDGFWNYSRHPNYFFEFVLWVAMAMITLPNITESWQYIVCALIPIVGYLFLVEFTGVPMCEKQSLKNRGEVYRKYQEEVNMFFPWFPRTSKKD